MPSVDDVLRQAFEASDEDWTLRAPSAHAAVKARHRRQQLVRRTVAGGLVAAALVVGATAVDGDSRTRTVEPAAPSPTSTATVRASTLEGTWVSGPLRAADVLAAASGAGTPEAAAQMLGDLPDAPFRVVMIVRGSDLRTLIRKEGAKDELMDEEVISTTGGDLELRTLFGAPASSVHRWTLEGDRLAMAFGSTAEGSQEGVPGEAWQRLLYDTSPYTRKDP